MHQDIAESWLEETFSKAPEKTWYAEQLLQGASYAELERLEPINEKQLKSIFPRATATQVNDPLKQQDKTRIHDNLRRNGPTFMANWLLNIFTLGSETTISLGLNRKYANKEREDVALKAISNNDTYLNILEDLMNRDEEVDLHTRQLQLLFAGAAFGRSVAVKQYGQDGLPCRLIPLSPTRLGRVWIDKYTHEFLGVEYKDYTTGKNILLAKDIIHYEENDFQITPNTRYFGMGFAEMSMAIGESNRACNEIAIPEITKRFFAPLMKITTHTRSASKLAEIKRAFRAGKIVFINDDIDVEVIPIPHDLDKVRETAYEQAKQIYTSFSVPLVVAFQEDQNRATAETTMLQWYEGTIAYRRSILDTVFWRQWYQPQLEKIMDTMGMANAASSEGGLVQHLIQKAKNPEPLPFRITMEYKNIRTTGFLDTAAGIAQFVDRRLIEPYMARTETGLDKWNDEMTVVESARQTLGNMMFSQAMGNQQPSSQQGPEAGGFGNQAGVPNLANRSQSVFTSKTALPQRTPRDTAE